MTYEYFHKNITPSLHNIEKLTLFSKYEPLACKDFLPIFKEIIQYDIETYFSTNGILLTDETIDVLVGNLDYLTISITGFTVDRYSKYMGGNHFETVCKNLKKLQDKKILKKTNLPKLRISTVAMLDTLEDLKAAIDLVDFYDIEEGLQVTSLKSFGDDFKGRMALSNIEIFDKKIEEAREYSDSVGVKFYFQGDSIGENIENTYKMGHKHCSMPWYRMSIQPNGDVYPCPVASNPIGNMNTESIDEIWNSNSMNSFRKGVNSIEEMNSDCLKCSHCRHKSLTSKVANDFTDKGQYVFGMNRKGK